MKTPFLYGVLVAALLTVLSFCGGSAEAVPTPEGHGTGFVSPQGSSVVSPQGDPQPSATATPEPYTWTPVLVPGYYHVVFIPEFEGDFCELYFDGTLQGYVTSNNGIIEVYEGILEVRFMCDREPWILDILPEFPPEPTDS
jgi:hypothetical protein